ncbi:hypothetical protein FO519_000092 [Halicephalobus sp. NKZ332]|nr:hypothetical protein FO519_000092 [Halicephalobus sp. NKZ332]
MEKVLLYLGVSFLIQHVSGAKVFVYNPHFAHSHFNFLGKLADILQEDGHNVTVFIPELHITASTVSKNASILVHRWKKNRDTLFAKPDHQKLIWGTGIEAIDFVTFTEDLLTDLDKVCDTILSDSELLSSLRKEKFDFGLLEPVDNCGFGLFKALGIDNYAIETPMAVSGIIASSHGLSGRSFIQFPQDLDNHPDLTFLQRLENFFHPILFRIFNNHGGIGVRAIKSHVDPDFDSSEAKGNARVVFVNSEEHIDFPRPISHKFVYIGGITVDSTRKSLPSEYEPIFNSTSKGVVLVSFGSLALSKDMPTDFKNAFVSLFQNFPEINFIWKYEDFSDTIADHLPNVFKFKWIDQKSILSHPKLLAFVSHGGMNSVLEAVHSGIPLLAVPLFGDQHRNVKMLEFRNTAIVIEKSRVSPSSLSNAVGKLMDPKIGYRVRAQKIAAIIRSKPLSARERFTKYFNHIVDHRNEPDFFEIKERKFNFIRFYNLDLYSFIGFCSVSFTYVIYSVLKIIKITPALRSKNKVQ